MVKTKGSKGEVVNTVRCLVFGAKFQIVLTQKEKEMMAPVISANFITLCNIIITGESVITQGPLIENRAEVLTVLLYDD